MNLLILSKCNFLTPTVLFCVSALCSTTAQSQETDTDDDNRTQNVITIEEITVTAQRSFYLLRAQLRSAQEILYSTYNDVNVNEDFDVTCRKTDWTHTHIQEQRCWPVFFEKLVAGNAQDALLEGDFFIVPVQQLANQYSERFDELRSNILTVANENPSVAEALIKMGTLEQAYKKKSEECMNKPAFLLIFRLCP